MSRKGLLAFMKYAGVRYGRHRSIGLAHEEAMEISFAEAERIEWEKDSDA